MNLNELIINTALLGTAAKELPIQEFPGELQDNFRELKEKAEDAESAFYRMAALGFAYTRAGLEPFPSGDAPCLVEAAEEKGPYLSREAGDVLTYLVANRNRHLLLYAYRRAAIDGKLIHPRYLQVLLGNAFDRNNPNRHEEQQLLSQLSGQRGRWLLPLMGLPAWGAKDEINWETASHEERKRLLLDTRKDNPAAGLALLRSELKNESAAHREELIVCLWEGLNPDDEAFLQEIVATDRSGNVKEKARQLLCGIPDSQQVRYYWELLKGKLRYNMLLGWSYDKLEFTPEMKKMGLSEVSSIKNEKDDRFLLRQLAERVPLAFWCEFYDCDKEKAARKLAKNPPFQNLFDYRNPIASFRDSFWAYHTLKEREDENLPDYLIGFLTPDQREEVDLQVTRKEMSIPEDWYGKEGTSWGIRFSNHVFQRCLSRSYYVLKEEMEQVATYLHPDMGPLIEKRMSSLGEQEQTALRTCQTLLDLIASRQRIDMAIIK